MSSQMKKILTYYDIPYCTEPSYSTSLNADIKDHFENCQMRLQISQLIVPCVQ